MGELKSVTLTKPNKIPLHKLNHFVIFCIVVAPRRLCGFWGPIVIGAIHTNSKDGPYPASQSK